MAIRLEKRILRFVVIFGGECGIGPRWDEIEDALVRVGFCATEIRRTLRRLCATHRLKARQLFYEARARGHYEVLNG